MAEGDTVLLEVTQLAVGYGGRALLPRFDLEVEAGELWAFIGQNGSGKTTILRTLLGLLPAVGGEVRWAEEARVGYVPQRSQVDQTVPARVVDLVGQGIDRDRSFLDPFYRRRHREQIERAMADTNIEKLRHRQFAKLSEGQKQRALMARALASNPRVLVLDEPTSAMDVMAEESVLELLDELRDSRDLAVLLVSHHLPVVARHATHALLVDKDTALIERGPIDEIASSQACLERYGRVLLDARNERRSEGGEGGE